LAYLRVQRLGRSEALIIVAGFSIPASVILFFGVAGAIPLLPGLVVSIILYFMALASALAYLGMKNEAYKNLDQKIPYLYLFMEIYLLSGLSPQEGLKRTAMLLEDPVLYMLYRYLEAGVPYTEALDRLLAGYRGPSSMYVSNLLHSSLFGTGGLKFLSETMEHLVNEKEKDIEKVTEQLRIITEVYTILGVFGPLVSLAGISALMGFGSLRGLNMELVMIGILFFAVISMAGVVALAQSIIHKVRV